jgi:hypothetical protein
MSSSRSCAALDFSDDRPTGYEARECLKCFRTTVWLKGFMVYPPDRFLINYDRLEFKLHHYREMLVFLWRWMPKSAISEGGTMSEL